MRGSWSKGHVRYTSSADTESHGNAIAREKGNPVVCDANEACGVCKVFHGVSPSCTFFYKRCRANNKNALTSRFQKAFTILDNSVSPFFPLSKLQMCRSCRIFRGNFRVDDHGSENFRFDEFLLGFDTFKCTRRFLLRINLLCLSSIRNKTNVLLWNNANFHDCSLLQTKGIFKKEKMTNRCTIRLNLWYISFIEMEPSATRS